MIVTSQALSKIWKRAPKAWVDAMAQVMPDWGINTKLRVAHFTAQIGHESNDLTVLQENLSYSAERLMAVWPRRFPTKASTKGYARNPLSLANFVYADRMGNGNQESGDGYKYRGRGPIQLTGRANYKAAGAVMRLPLVQDPDMVLDLPVVGCSIACWYWSSRGLNDLADRNETARITMRINGGLNGLQDREKRTALALSLL